MIGYLTPNYPLVAAFRAARRVPWEEVAPADRLLMSPRQIREKYVLRKLK